MGLALSLLYLDAWDAETGLLQVVIETPRGSRNKYKYDERLGMFILHKVLPLGMVFPLDFSFIPSTKGDDGDPLDVLLLMDEPAFCGCVAPAAPASSRRSRLRTTSPPSPSAAASFANTRTSDCHQSPTAASHIRSSRTQFLCPSRPFVRLGRPTDSR